MKSTPIPQWAPITPARTEPSVPAYVGRGARRARGLRHAFYVVDRWLMFLLRGPDPLDKYVAPRSMGWGASIATRAFVTDDHRRGRSAEMFDAEPYRVNGRRSS